MYCKLEGEDQYWPYEEVARSKWLDQVIELRADGSGSGLASAPPAIGKLLWRSMTALKKISIAERYKLTDFTLPDGLVLSELEEISMERAIYDSQSMRSLLDHSPNLNHITIRNSTHLEEWDEDEDEKSKLIQRIAEINEKKSASMPSGFGSVAGKLTGETEVPDFEQSSEQSGQSTPDRRGYRKIGSSGDLDQYFGAPAAAAASQSGLRRTAKFTTDSDSDASPRSSQSRLERARSRRANRATAVPGDREEWQQFEAARKRKMSRKTESDSGSDSESSASDGSTMRGVTSASARNVPQNSDSQGITLHIVQNSRSRIISMNDFLIMRTVDKQKITEITVSGDNSPLSLNLSGCNNLQSLTISKSTITGAAGMRMIVGDVNLRSIRLVECVLNTRGVLQILADGPHAKLSIEDASIVTENKKFLDENNLSLFTHEIINSCSGVQIESITLAAQPFMYESDSEESDSDLDVRRLPGSVPVPERVEATNGDDDEHSLSTVSSRPRATSADTIGWTAGKQTRGQTAVDTNWMDDAAEEPRSMIPGGEVSDEDLLRSFVAPGSGRDLEDFLDEPGSAPRTSDRGHSKSYSSVPPPAATASSSRNVDTTDYQSSLLGGTDTQHSRFDQPSHTGFQSEEEPSPHAPRMPFASYRRGSLHSNPNAHERGKDRGHSLDHSDVADEAAASSSTRGETIDYMHRRLGGTDTFPNTVDRTRAKNRSVARRKQSSERSPGLHVDSSPNVQDRGYPSDHSDVVSEAAPSSLRDANADNRRDNVMSSRYGVSSKPAPSLRPRNAATGYRSNTMDAGSTHRDLGGAGMQHFGSDQPPGSQHEAESPLHSHTGNSGFSFERERDREYSSVPPTAAAAASSRTHQMRENLRSHRLPDQTSHVFRGQRYKVDTEVEMDARADEPRDLSTIERSISEGLERYLPVTTERDSYALTVNQRNNIVQLNYISQDSRRHDIIPVLSASSESVKVYKSWQRQVDPGNQAIPLLNKALIILASLGIPPDFPEGGIRVSQENSKLGREVIKQYQVLKELHKPDEDIDLTVSVNRRR